MKNKLLIVVFFLFQAPLTYGEDERRDGKPAVVGALQTNDKSGIFNRVFSRWFEKTSAISIETKTSQGDLRAPKKRNGNGRKLPFGTDLDDHFKKYTKHYFGVGADWRWFRAQAIVESELKPRAHSKAGAMGIMQIMPRTFKEIRKSNPSLTDPFNAHYSIAAGIYYNYKLYKSWYFIKNNDDRRKFMFASYNAGLGYVQRISRKMGGSHRYASIESRLSKEPKDYVVKIERERQSMYD